jgi:hypothetical protein
MFSPQSTDCEYGSVQYDASSEDRALHAPPPPGAESGLEKGKEQQGKEQGTQGPHGPRGEKPAEPPQ